MRHPLAADLELARNAARRAGAAALRHFGQPLRVDYKAPDQPVTRADLDADAALREELLADRPDYGWLSEETPDGPDRIGRQRVWIVDPVDGTRSFIAGRPEFAVSVGLAEDGVVVAGVVFNPATDELFHALLGGGAYLDAGGAGPRRIVVTAPAGAGVSVLASRTEIAAGAFNGAPDTWTVRPLGSTAYKMARIAAGEADLFVSRAPKSEWDVCAATLLIAEAGGRTTDLAGATPRFNRATPLMDGVLASNGTVHDAALAATAGLPPVPRSGSTYE